MTAEGVNIGIVDIIIGIVLMLFSLGIFIIAGKIYSFIIYEFIKSVKYRDEEAEK